ncbi:HVO_0476 family zinc finger protein [Halolamina sediminis]|uniref:HVO_0476 family zinc finger protein n=1 Tax=Halolamina sediminis TaxID=1480675 RepID=UPI0006B55A95|nr:HVO_0476 family zinc finger protein [Halolamina sediminis]
MSDSAERVPLTCPSCSPHEQTVHEVLSPGGQSTVRCTECGHVHKQTIETPDEITVDVVVSQDGDSYKTTLDAESEESVEAGDEFVVETEAAIQQVEVTSIEVGPERRTEHAEMDEVETVWTRVVDNVGVNVTIHPKEGDGRNEQSRSTKVFLPGDFEFVVGESHELGDDEFTVDSLQLRDAIADDYRHKKLDHEGDLAFAKDIKRVFGRDERTSAWSAW